MATTLSFSKAAQTLHVSQPALSHQVRMLEESLGVPLLSRTTRNVELTDDGRYLLEQLVPSFGNIENVVAGFMRGHRRTTVFRVATVPSAASLYLPRILQRLRSQVPQAEIEIKEVTSSAAVEIIQSKGAHVGFLRTADTTEQETLKARFSTLEFPRYPLKVVVSTHHPMASKDRVDLKEFREDYFLDHDPLTAPAWSSLMDQACARSGLEPKVLCTGTELMTIYRLVSANVAVVLLPADMYGLIRSLRIKAMDLYATTLSSGITAIWEKTDNLGWNIRCVATMLQELNQHPENWDSPYL